MHIDLLTKGLLIVAAVCLVKIAFFPGVKNEGIIPSAHADGALIEWKDANRIVSTSSDGAATYVWDYEGKTRVRKYSIDGDSLKLKTYFLENK